MYTHRQEKGTTTLDVVYLSGFGLFAAVAAWAIFGAGEDSWFHTEKNHSLALMFLALGILGVIDLTNAATNGKTWVKLTPLYRFEHPKVFALQTGMAKLMVAGCVVGIVALLFFLPPL